MTRVTGLTSFVVELLLDEEGQVKRTKVMHVTTGHEDTWTGWREKRLVGFFIEQAAMRLPSAEPDSAAAAQAEPTPRSFVTPEPVPTPATTARSTPSPDQTIESPAPLAPTVAPTGEPRLQKLETIPVSANYPSQILGNGQPFDVRLTLDLSEMQLPKEASLNYTATIYARSLGARPQRLVGEAHGARTPDDRLIFDVKSEGLRQGVYRLHAVVTLNIPTAKSQPASSFLTHLESSVIQVY